MHHLHELVGIESQQDLTMYPPQRAMERVTVLSIQAAHSRRSCLANAAVLTVTGETD